MNSSFVPPSNTPTIYTKIPILGKHPKELTPPLAPPHLPQLQVGTPTNQDGPWKLHTRQRVQPNSIRHGELTQLRMIFAEHFFNEKTTKKIQQVAHIFKYVTMPSKRNSFFIFEKKNMIAIKKAIPPQKLSISKPFYFSHRENFERIFTKD